jgi:hypothetical protein
VKEKGALSVKTRTTRESLLYSALFLSLQALALSSQALAGARDRAPTPSGKTAAHAALEAAAELPVRPPLLPALTTILPPKPTFDPSGRREKDGAAQARSQAGTHAADAAQGARDDLAGGAAQAAAAQAARAAGVDSHAAAGQERAAAAQAKAHGHGAPHGPP